MSDIVTQIVKSRALWGGAILVVQALFGPEVGEAVKNVFTAVDTGAVAVIVTAVGGALVAVGRIWGKPILAKV